MLPVYNDRSEAIKTVYTYEEWLKEYNRRETQRKEEIYILYETTHVWFGTGNYWSCYADYIERCDLFIGCTTTWNIFDAYKREGYDILGRKTKYEIYYTL